VRSLLNATTGLIMLSAGQHGDAMAVWSRADGSAGEDRLPDVRDAITSRGRESPGGVLVSLKTASEAERLALKARGASDVRAVPLRFRSFVQGHLELWDPQGALRSFTLDDLRFLENLASHLAAGIENQQLVDQLRHEVYHDRLTGLPNRERFVLAVD